MPLFSNMLIVVTLLSVIAEFSSLLAADSTSVTEVEIDASTHYLPDLWHQTFRVQISPESLIVSRADTSLPVMVFTDSNKEWLSVGRAELPISLNHGSFDIRPRKKLTCHADHINPVVSEAGNFLSLNWQLFGRSEICKKHSVTLELYGVNARRLGFRIYSDLPGTNFIEVRATSSKEERFYGFGLQPTYLDLKGKFVPIWAQEQGIMRGRQPYSWVMNRAASGSSGSTVSSYMVAPYFITNKQRGLFLKNTEYAELDLTKKRELSLTLYSSQMQGELLSASRPLELVSAYTEYSGRMRQVPDWFHAGAIVGLQGGSERVRKIWRKIRDRGTPLSAIWLQDWVGQRTTAFGQQLWWNWELDEHHYPDWDNFLDELRGDHVRVLGYINPHLVDTSQNGGTSAHRNLYDEAKKQGFLVKDFLGADYPVRLGTLVSAMIDLANPNARKWIKSVIREQIIARGFSGWMCDFSESLPHDAVMYTGEQGRDFHHRYIEEWARVNAEAIEEAGLADDTVFFCRAGHTQSPGIARFFWQGDQTVSWDRFDGLKSAVTGLIGGGISGYSLNHSDIGGYTGFSVAGVGLRRTQELLARWQEFSAFTPAFRTHEGLLPEANAQIYDSDDSLAVFDCNARIFQSLHFYRKRLFADAEAHGYPVVRAMFLEFPEDPQAYGVDDQFMLGSEILVAPVVKPQQDKRLVYLPAGKWVHIWSGRYFGNLTHSVKVTVPAPVGEPPAFYKAGSQIEKEWKVPCKN